MANYEKTWQFDINRAISALTIEAMAKYTLWYYKAFLTGQIGGATLGLWTVAGSSDAINGAMDGVDRWTSTYDILKIVRGAGVAVKSWVVLKSPYVKGFSYYLLINYNTAVDYQVSMSVSATLPTGGSNTVAPTMTNAASPLAGTGFAPSANFGDFHLHSGLATDGSFFILQSRDNTGKFVSGFVGSWMGNAKITDSYPFWFSLGNDSALGSGYGILSYGLENSNFGFMIPPDNSTQTTWTWAGVISVATNLPTSSDLFDSSYLDLPIFIASSAPTIRSMRGRLQDIAYSPGTTATGTVDSTLGAPTYMIVGNYWFPTNAAPIL